MQLVQLQQAQERFKSQGIGLAAVSYDSEDILKDFAQRQKITFPLLADPKSEIIQQYGVLNTGAKGITQGMAFPGFFYVGADGRVREKFFESDYRERYTANTVIAKLFPELAEKAGATVKAPHLALTLRQSDQTAVPGSRVTLAVEIELPRDVHLYAPGVKGYKQVELVLEPSTEFKASAVQFPASKILFLKPINEHVPVFTGKFRISQDVTVATTREFSASVGQGRQLTIKGELRYQACDDKVCYNPVTTPVSWDLQVAPLDLQRSPEGVRHR